MNASLQCLLHVEELAKYFLIGFHNQEINHRNVMGTKGRIAEKFGDLMYETWTSRSGRIQPYPIKETLGGVNQQFSGMEQQDAFELLNYLLDTLHEDLNRVLEKPYIEEHESRETDDQVLSTQSWSLFLQ